MFAFFFFCFLKPIINIAHNYAAYEEHFGEKVIILCKNLSQAFADYEFQPNAEELRTMWKRRGFDPELSFAAFEGSTIVAFTLNGIGTFSGIRMAYDTGTGTLPAYRGQGLATKIFNYSIPYLKEANINHYLLEVLQHNTYI